MKYEMVMPKMGESITDGTILKWLKQAGDEVEKDEIILEISTDKVDSEIPSPIGGKLQSLLAQEGDTIDVGAVIAIIETDSGAVDEADVTKERETEKKPEESSIEITTKEKEQSIEKTAHKTESKKEKGNRFYSPVVLNIAREENVDFQELDRIKGSGLNGRVTKKDLLNYLKSGRQETLAETKFSGSEPVEIIEMDHVRKSIAKHMVQSKQTSAHVSLYTEVDMNNIYQIREKNKNAFKNREGFGLTYMAFITEATINAIKEFPMLNASIENDKIIVKHFVNLGIAVAVDYGLIVPNIFHADEKNLIGLARSINDLALRARNKKLKPDEVSAGTFSISNFGVYGTLVGFPIINQPQVAILGVGSVNKKAVVIDDAIAIRPMMYLSLTIDHRLIDGAMGAQFLEKIKHNLQNYDIDMKI